MDNVDCVGLGFLMDNSDSGDSGSLTGMRCAVVSRSPGIILTTTTTFSRVRTIMKRDFETKKHIQITEEGSQHVEEGCVQN